MSHTPISSASESLWYTSACVFPIPRMPMTAVRIIYFPAGASRRQCVQRLDGVVNAAHRRILNPEDFIACLQPGELRGGLRRHFDHEGMAGAATVPDMDPVGPGFLRCDFLRLDVRARRARA